VADRGYGAHSRHHDAAVGTGVCHIGFAFSSSTKSVLEQRCMQSKKRKSRLTLVVGRPLDNLASTDA
jgi:hypothetical protein